jgi:hypothetical protein
VTLIGNINALLPQDNGGQKVELSADNSIALNIILRRKLRRAVSKLWSALDRIIFIGEDMSIRCECGSVL